MARIRSIKPDFFLDDTMAAQPISARLTFLGLLTYVDDNGVGLDNERLIMAALYPLDEDLLDTIRRLREDLRSLSGAGRIRRYSDGEKSYIEVVHFSRHQKVSHPRSPRYPSALDLGLTCNNADSGVAPEDSGAAPESLRPDQGSGIRDQGVVAKVEDKPSKPSRSPSKKALSDDWEPTDSHKKTAADKGLDLGLVAAKFRAHAEANARRQVSWNAAFTQWLLSEKPVPAHLRAVSGDTWTTKEPEWKP